ncbi:aromatic ring-hydroxylating dioxygenase subunit alpha [Alteraurantiacibacter buctensis]|uniref:Rieske 2Fe-2S domain-containing protein n=1 Tax=Alteraurantiacibacter buctensis TaxID=1503981 RepID=A0A844Z1L7_9SPHN|nr:aromatic ring-hydroxylating dioxygenase subunit alpha [Alteraurantiacibacter buctensis]MXO71803.1 Rieske 2Fe-2S domain-containing protein [Alteraurantiacibacter buctensis]
MSGQAQATPENVWPPPRPAGERNYPMNCWWVAALADEVTQDLLGRWLCDTPVLLYRREDGTAIAIEDRCPHRSAPLSLGCRKGDNVECGYHGFTFSPDGSCVRVPSMKTPPPALRVRAFPVIESYPFIWVYLGDPARIDDVPAPHVLDWATDPAFAEVHGRIDIAANYLLLKENVLDLTHFGFVHAKSFQITDWVEAPRLTGEGDICGYHQAFSASPLPPPFAVPMGLPVGTPYDRSNYGSFVSPALQIAAVDLIEPGSKQITGRFRVSHATTPIDQTHMHYFWVGGRDFATSDQEMDEFKALTELGFAEDEVMIEAVQRVQSRDPRPTHLLEKSVKADGPGVQARRIVARWMERETS